MQKGIMNLVIRIVVSIIGGSYGAGRLIFIASMILSFKLPFALIPLLKFSSNTTKMGRHKNSMIIIVISWILGLGVIGINVYYLISEFVGWIIHSSLSKAATVFIKITVFPLMALYIISIIYLTFRKNTFQTIVEVNEDSTMRFVNNVQLKLSWAHFREDLADTPLIDGPRL